jgi:hypothetical protein
MTSDRKQQLRRRWMTYPIYVVFAMIVLDLLFFFITLNDTHEFIGERGVEYCWAYGSFTRYVVSHLASITVLCGILYVLYLLARRDYLTAYVGVVVACLVSKLVLSFFGLGLC